MFVGHINIQSISKNFEKLQTFMFEHDFDVIGVSETWLTNQVNSASFCVPRYYLLIRDGSGRGDGVALLYISVSLHVEILNNDVQGVDRFNQLWVSTKIGKYSLAIGLVYKSSTVSIDIFCY